MTEDFRGMLARMEAEGHVRRIGKPVKPQHLSALIAQASTALRFDAVEDYDLPVAGGLFWTRARLAASLGWPAGEMAARFAAGAAKPVPVEVVERGACQEEVVTGEAVDLTALPIPFMHEKDGGPYISGGISFAGETPEGLNAGCYRLMFRTRREMAIDLFTASDLRRRYTSSFERGEALPISVAIGVHAFEHMAAAFKAPVGVSEMAVAGGLRGAPVAMVRGVTNRVLVPASAEIVLEGELLPNGWTADEGPFGEFAGMQGDLKHNPLFRVNAVTQRRGAIFYALQMPWENDWLNGPATEAACLRILSMIGIEVTAVNATEGGCCGWSVVAAIRKRAGEGKNAISALLSLPTVKQVIVVDDDIDVYNPAEVEWAVTFRCQADQDIVILSGLKGKHVDPSLRPWDLPPGMLPVTSKFGIDATIPEGIPGFRYERIVHAFGDRVRLEDYL
jgi:2,5-furandicarboxylate decarboxylase 1